MSPTTTALRRYLTRHNWELIDSRSDGIDVYRSGLLDDDGAPLLVLAPARDGMHDEVLLRANLLRALASMEGRSVDAILAEMAADHVNAA